LQLNPLTLYVSIRERVKAATKSTATGKIPLSYDYVIEARLLSDSQTEAEPEASDDPARPSLEVVSVEQLSVNGSKDSLL
jgi:hypothetical protein